MHSHIVIFWTFFVQGFNIRPTLKILNFRFTNIVFHMIQPPSYFWRHKITIFLCWRRSWKETEMFITSVSHTWNILTKEWTCHKCLNKRIYIGGSLRPEDELERRKHSVYLWTAEVRIAIVSCCEWEVADTLFQTNSWDSIMTV